MHVINVEIFEHVILVPDVARHAVLGEQLTVELCRKEFTFDDDEKSCCILSF